MLDRVAAAERGRHADEPGQHRADRQHDERERHRLGRVVGPVPGAVPAVAGIVAAAWPWAAPACRAPVARRLPRRPAVGAEEGQRHQPEHVERGHQRGERRQPVHQLVLEERLQQDLVLAEEPGERRDAGDGDRADHHRPERDRHVLLQAAHLQHVLLAGHRVDDRAAAEEEERLEEGVRHQVERAGRERADAHRHEHVAELRDGRIRQHPLDVGLHEADRRGHQRRQHADDRDDLHRHRRVREEDGVAADHVDAGGDHRRRVDQRGDGRRAFHGVGQPDVERDLRALAARADEQQQRDERQRAELRRLDRERRGGVRHLAEIERPEREVDQEDAEQEAPVADPVGDERLLARVRRALLLVPVADEQVRAEADALPADEHDQVVAAQHQREHEEAEQVQVREVARHAAARLVVHVGGRVDVDQEPDPRDDQDHHRRQRIEAERPRDVQRRRSRRRFMASAVGGIQSNRTTSWTRASGARPSSCTKASTDRPNAAAIVVHATARRSAC